MGINYNTLNRNRIVTFGSASEPLRRDRISTIISSQTIQQPSRVHPINHPKLSKFVIKFISVVFRSISLTHSLSFDCIFVVVIFAWCTCAECVSRWLNKTMWWSVHIIPRVHGCKCGRTHSLVLFIYLTATIKIYCVLMWQFHFVTDTNG